MPTNQPPSPALVTILSQAAAKLGAALFVLVAFAILYEVISRYLLGSPSIWVEELSLLAQVWATYLGMAYVLQSRAMLRIELVAERFGRLGQQISEWLGLIVIAACALLIIVLSVESLLESLAQQRASASLLVLPSWLVELSLPIGFSLLLVQALLHMLQLVKQPITAEPRP